MNVATGKRWAVAIAVLVIVLPLLAQPSPHHERPRTRVEAAWKALADGRNRDALRHFSRLIWLDRTDGGSKIGYALTAAALGDLGRGAQVMRRALRIDPEALFDLPIDASLRARIDPLTAGYLHRIEGARSNQDAAFMLAALYYLGGDSESAGYAIGMMAANGDQTPSAMNLMQLVRERSD